MLGDPAAESITLGDYLDANRYSKTFIDDHLLPMAAAIWSAPVDEMRRHPAQAFVRFCASHGLLKISDRPQWRTVRGGSREYVRRLLAGFDHEMRLGDPVVAAREVLTKSARRMRIRRWNCWWMRTVENMTCSTRFLIRKTKRCCTATRR